MQNLKIAVSGGSITGCAITALLKIRYDAKITVFERSPHSLSGRGAGIVLPENIIQQCVKLDLFDADIPRLPMNKRMFIVQDNRLDHLGREIWQQELPVSTLNWSDIYQNLRKRIPEECYHTGAEIMDVQITPQGCEVTFKDNLRENFDLVIAADGIDSGVRNKIFPDLKPQYAGYIAWRGTIPMTGKEIEKIFSTSIPYYVFSDGHLLLYSIPANDYASTGKKLLNWVMYQVCNINDLEKLLVDNEGKQHKVSLPPGSLTPMHIQQLQKFVKTVLPSEIANLISQTEKPFIQAIYDLQVPHFVTQRVCFMGDSAVVLRPHTASGVLKALNDSISFITAIESNPEKPLTAILNEWNANQLKMAEQQIALARNMGKALVTESPTWHTMDPAAMAQWWQDCMTGKSWYALKQ